MKYFQDVVKCCQDNYDLMKCSQAIMKYCQDKQNVMKCGHNQQHIMKC